MMSKTHISVGIAAALAVSRPSTPAQVLAAVSGGALGGVLCDIECRSRRGMRDPFWGRAIVLCIVFGALWADLTKGYGIAAAAVEAVRQHGFARPVVGLLLLIVTLTAGRLSPHRTFTHSLLFVALISYGFSCLSPLLTLPVFAGGISHLAIDTLNRKPVPWLFPFFQPGICLRLCYADGLANALLGLCACVLAIALVFLRLRPLFL